MRFVNVTVSDVAPLLECHNFESKNKAIEKIRRRGGIRWRPRRPSLHARDDEYAAIRSLPASREFEERLHSNPSQFLNSERGEDDLDVVEGRILSDALGMAMDVCPKLIASFVNTEFGKAMERHAISRVETKNGLSVKDRQRPFRKMWTHPRVKSIKVCLTGCVDAMFRDSRGNEGVLEIKCRRSGFRTGQRHETIQLRTYLTLAKCNSGILVQFYDRAIRKRVVKRNDDWFYRRVKPTIDRIALQIATQGSQKRRCRSKGNA